MAHLLLYGICLFVVTTSLPGAIAVVIPGVLSFSGTCQTSTATIDGNNVTASTCLTAVTTTAPISWVEAQSKCNQDWNGANLVTINDADKNNAVLSATPLTHGCWIGLIDVGGENGNFDWRNLDLQAPKYFNWCPTCPINDRLQHCGFIHGNGFVFGNDGMLDNNVCSGDYAAVYGSTPEWNISCFICESTTLELNSGAPVVSQEHQ